MSKSLNVWQPVGQDVVRDAMWGRLGNNGDFGRTVVSGATNAIAVHQQKNQTSLFAGTVNGGIFSRSLSKNLEWDDRPQWRWVSNPSNGYIGSQGVGQLAISKNGKWLAVGQGNPSNYKAISTRSRGLVIGAFDDDGLIRWVEPSRQSFQKLDGHNIRSLQWLGSNTMLATSMVDGGGSVIKASLGKKGDLDQIDVLDVNTLNLVSASQDQFSVLAGENLVRSEYGNKILLADNKTLKQRGNADPLVAGLAELRGPEYVSLLQQYDQEKATIRRVDVAQTLVDQRLIVFIGLSKRADDRDDLIYRVDRLEINPESLQIIDGKVFRAEDGEIGSSQASNDRYYGNFSFSIDPRSDDGLGIFLGGNHFANSSSAPGMSYGGGLVYVDFKGDIPVISERLYGPRIQLSEKGKEQLVRPISPGQPHADSREIAFVKLDENPILLQTDDGGVWGLPLKKKAGKGPKSDQFWQPLSAPGLNAFEVMMNDWHAQSNGVVASYQDNAASYALSGELYANNMWGGDGQIALIDDASDDSLAQAYLSSYQYIADGAIAGLKINDRGFLESYSIIDFFLQDVPGTRPVLWNQTVESISPETAPFILPIELNPYRKNSMVMAGRMNLYEAVSVDSEEYPNSIIFRSLLTPRTGLSVTALDNHGNHFKSEFQSIYAAVFENGHPQIVGRRAGDDEFYLNQLIYDGAKDSDLEIAHGMIVDLAHRPNPDGADNVYWLQGGLGIIQNSFGAKPAVQVLRFRTASGDLKTFDLSSLGVENNPTTDLFQLQSIVFVPAKGKRSDSLVVSGLTGHWISPLSGDGMPTGFERMKWTKPYQPVSPNVYPTSVKYDPQDDLLIAGTLGKGSWIYRFSKDKMQRPDPDQLLHSSDVNLTQFVEHDLDKRDNQQQSYFTLQIDRRVLPDPRQDVRVKLILKDWSQWRRRLIFVSPLDFNTDNEDALNAMNLLGSEGVEAFGGKILNGDRIAVPLDFEDENSTIALQFIAEEFSLPEDDVILRYKVKHQGGSEQTHSKITLARPSRDSTDFEVHGEVIDDKSQIIPGAPPLYRSLDPDHLSISRNNEPELVDPFPLDCW